MLPSESAINRKQSNVIEVLLAASTTTDDVGSAYAEHYVPGLAIKVSAIGRPSRWQLHTSFLDSSGQVERISYARASPFYFTGNLPKQAHDEGMCADRRTENNKLTHHRVQDANAEACAAMPHPCIVCSEHSVIASIRELRSAGGVSWKRSWRICSYDARICRCRSSPWISTLTHANSHYETRMKCPWNAFDIPIVLVISP
jgi:hypothetical protein